jgi:small subunit ribosomal protein S18
MMKRRVQKVNTEPKQCYFCQHAEIPIDYKNVQLMRKFMSPHAKLMGRKKTGSCATHQHRVIKALKRARHMAFLPFVAP